LIGATLIAELATVARVALADPPVTTVVPTGTAISSGMQDTAPPANNGTARVFHFADVPGNRHVPLIRAVFDQGGYQLFDTAGETIVVPFAGRNLYVMKFAVSPNDAMYFVNDDGTPILYVPRNGYLENATVPGARWYPFTETFHPTSPVFLGIAPSYTEFIDTNWHPETVLHGGYYGARPFPSGGQFAPSPGLTLFFGSHPYSNWRDYRQFAAAFPSPYRFGYSNRPIYGIGLGPRNGHPFLGCVTYPNNSFHPGNGSYVRDHSGTWGSNGIRDRDNGAPPPSGGAQSGSARYTGKPNFLDSRDRAPGPVFDRPSESRPGGNRPIGNRPGDNPANRPGMTTGGRTDGNSRRDNGRTPGGSRSSARSPRSGGRGER
jgi:hypothetical protein